MTKDIPMPWGKYKGVLICDIPSDYLKWVIDKSDADDEIRDAAESEYEFRTTWNNHFYSQ